MDIEVLGIDLGKTVSSLAGLDAAGAVVFRKRLQRHRLLDFLDRLAGVDSGRGQDRITRHFGGSV